MNSQPQWLRDARQRELDQFKPGTEVVVTLHGECQPMVKHGDQEIGVRGLVVRIDTDARDGHTLIVYYRAPLPVKGSFGCYTTGEVRPFDFLNDIAWPDAERAALSAVRQPQSAREER